MDCKIWENTILAWVNTLKCGTPINSINQLNDVILIDIIKKFKSDFQNPVEFLKATFPNLSVSDSFALSSSHDYLCALTCLLIYVSFSNKSELEELREKMCVVLDNSTQLKIAEFLTCIANHQDVFQLSFKSVKNEIFNFTEIYDAQNSFIGDSLNTPVKNNLSTSSYDSPLQGFFQTPKRNLPKPYKKPTSVMSGDGDHVKQIKQLTDQLVEEESEKAVLQEKLMASIQRCNEYENKLKDKLEEIKHLRFEWDNENKKNEEEITEFKNKFEKKFEDEKKLKGELCQLENFVSSLESDLADSLSEQAKLEHKLKVSLEKYTACELQCKEAALLIENLQEVIANKEKEMVQLKDSFENAYKNDKAIDLSFTESSFDTSASAPESMGVVVEKLLHEKNEENLFLKEALEELRTEKNNLLLKVESMVKELEEKNSISSELVYLNKELHSKVDLLAKTEKELSKTKEDLRALTLEIDKLNQENSKLVENCNVLSAKLSDHDQVLLDYKNTKMLVYFDYLKLADDFKTVQQRLEFEVNNILKLTSDKKEKQLFESHNKINVLDFKEKIGDKECEINNIAIIKDMYNSQLTDAYFCDLRSNSERPLEPAEGGDFDWSDSKLSIQQACMQLNDSIVTLKLKINDLEMNQRNSIEERAEFEEELKASKQKLAEIQVSHSSEIKKLMADIDQKKIKIKELEELVLKLNSAHSKKLPEKDISKNLKMKIKLEDLPLTYEGDKKATFTEDVEVSSNLPIKNNLSVISVEKEELDDSLEVIPVCNKTFDIVNLEEKNIIDKTFSVERNVESVQKLNKIASWSVSPPPKITHKSIKRGKKYQRGSSWIVPFAKTARQKVSSSTNDLTTADSSSNLTKSSSLSSIREINSLPPSKVVSESSTATFFSLTDLSSSSKEKDYHREPDSIKAFSSEVCLKNFKSSSNTINKVFKLVDRQEDPLGDIFRNNVLDCDQNKKLEWEKMFSRMRKEILELSNECERLRASLMESEQKRKKAEEDFKKTQDTVARSISSKYENRLEHLKSEMKQLYNMELAKHKADQSRSTFELREQNKRYKEHIDQLRNQLWDLGEKLLQEQKSKRDLERVYNDLKKKFEVLLLSKNKDLKFSQNGDTNSLKDFYGSKEKSRVSTVRQFPNSTFATIPTEDEDEIFDNRFLEDMKKGHYPTENPEGRLMELQNRNTLCLPHLKSSYPAETQFLNPSLFKENDIKQGLLHFGQESQSLTDSDHSMTRSLLPENKGKKKEQTSYKKPGPPTPSKHGRRHSVQGGEIQMTPRSALKDLNDINERNKGTPSRLKSLLPVKSARKESLGGRDENVVPVTPRKKLGKIFRKPFGARDH